MIGKTSTTKRDLTRGDLLGRCEGATHFVRRALLGAFALRTGSNAEVVTAAELFGAGAGSSSKSDKIVANRDGDLNACMSSSLTASEPPNGCGALLRLELLPIAESPDIKTDKEEPGIGCPEGLVRRDGKCASPVASAPAPTCTNALDQFDTCISECDQRMSPSCDHLLHDHLVLSSDQQKKYAQILGTMCERGADEACVKLAQRYRDANGVAEDRARADALAMGACGNGNAEGCWLLMQLRKSDVESRKMSARACYAGSAQACGQLGSIYAMDNKGNEAGPFFERACDGGLDDYCLEGAKLFETGNNGTTRDAKRSAALYWGVCKGKSSQLGCHKVAEVAGADFARPLMETHCRARATADSVCYRLASFYDVGEYGFSQDRARAAELFETICMDKGDTMTCAKAADALVSARGDKGKPHAIELLRKGCKDPNTSKDWSCNRLKQMGENP
ncbi:MAG: hypothetical protein CVU63_10295 [Deltaproteobacteria bacterium HGW-Deltaproteobacteria-20]|jgi:hypothetical protein|nr:MAG: hypothetical protein CVU63_10295 [Deltaproteobacteria bacterium HGW-Deltaproteobacteria-20]